MYVVGAVVVTSVVGALLTWAIRRSSHPLDLYAEVQYDPYPDSYAFRIDKSKRPC